MEQSFSSLKGKRVLITGSSRGIGRALAIGFAQNGADVAVHGVSQSRALSDTLQAVCAYGGNGVAVFGDLSDKDIPEKLIEETVKKLGGIDILVNNASIQIRRKWREINHSEMLSQMQVNFFSGIALIQKAEEYMEKNKWGRIITIGSVQQDKPHPDMLIYAASKAAMLNVVKNLALQTAQNNITVNNIAVGTIYTDRNAEVLKDEIYHQAVIDSIPMKRIGQVEDCVGTVLMLASDAGKYITGENIHVDGGKNIL